MAPYVALNFTVYETLRNFASARADSGEPSVGLRLACGGAAGAIAQTCTYPLDVLRRRMQVSDQLGFGYRNTWDACQTILRKEGVLAFYKGIVPNFLKVVPSISISFVSYEFVKKVLS